MSYLYQKGNQFPNQKLENFTIALNQPIFKSGGIWAAIKYANAKRIAGLYGVKAQRNDLIALAIELAYKIKRLDLQIQKQRLLIKNAKIDVEVKKDAYLHGLLDSTFLNNAIVQKNSAQLVLLNLQQQRAELVKNFKDLSDLPLDIKLPRFSLIPKKSFLQRSIVLKQTQEEIAAAKYKSYMQIARYLPSLAVIGNYNYQVMRGSLYFPDYSRKDHYYTYGIQLSMPLFDINAKKNIEEAKVAYLQARNKKLQQKRELGTLFAQIEKRLQIIDKMEKLAREDSRLYSQLLQETKELVKAGEKTKWDVQTMRNSLRTKEIDLQIYAIDRQLLLLKLYKEMEDAF